MKLLYFDNYKLGVLKGDAVVDVSSVVEDIPHIGPHDLISGLIERFAQYRARLEETAARGKAVPVRDVKIRPPLPRPGNLDCMALNYKEASTRSEPAPINAFLKSPNGIIGHEDSMVLPDVPATVFEGEAEVAVVMGRRAFNVRAADAMEYFWERDWEFQCAGRQLAEVLHGRILARGLPHLLGAAEVVQRALKVGVRFGAGRLPLFARRVSAFRQAGRIPELKPE